MSKLEEKNAARRAASREKILSAATALFARKGIAGTGVQEIADMADLSVGMLYRHFKTKEDIYGALAEKAIEDMGTFSKFLEIEMPPADLIKFAASNTVKNINNSDEYVQFQKLLFSIMGDIPAVLPHMVDTIWKSYQSFRGSIASLIERGQNDGSFREGCAEGMTTMFLAALQGLTLSKLAAQDQYVSPTPQMLTAFLLKDEHNAYEDIAEN